MISYNSQCPLINSFLGSSPFLIFLLLGKCTNEFNDSCNILQLACMSCLQSIFLSFNITNQQRVYWPVFATKAFLCCGCRSCQSIIVLALAVPFVHVRIRNFFIIWQFFVYLCFIIHIPLTLRTIENILRLIQVLRLYIIEVRTSKSYPDQQKRRGSKEVRGGKRLQPNRH